MIALVLMMLEQMAYLEFLGAEYTAFQSIPMYADEKEAEDFGHRRK